MTDKKLLVVGIGSIGKRHIDNFKDYFNQIDIVDTRDDRILEAKNTFNINKAYSNYKEALEKNSYNSIVISVPPHLHLEIARTAALNDINLFIEKPLGMNVNGWDEIIDICHKKKLKNYVAFCHRHIPYTASLKSLLDTNRIGDVYNFNLRWGSYLPDWHPHEDYRSFYMAKKDQGGGALLDESHGIDLVRYLFGEVHKVYASVGNFSNLEISSDDSAFLTMIFKRNIISQINFDLNARHPRINLEIVGEKGTIIWDRVKHLISVYDSESKEWSNQQFTKDDLMMMYPLQAKHFYDCINNDAIEMVNIKDALKTQEIIDASFLSSSQEKMIYLTK